MPLLNWIKKQILAALADTTDVKKGDALVGFGQPVPGAVPRTVHDKLTEWVSVKDFGAAGDGVADDAAAIQAAVDSFGDNGGAVFFPAGIYEVKSEIRISHVRVSLRGAGRHATHVRFQPDQDHQALFKFDRGAAGMSSQCAIQDMALVSSQDTGLSITAIELKDTSNISHLAQSKNCQRIE